MHNYIQELITANKDFKAGRPQDKKLVLQKIAHVLALRTLRLFTGQTCALVFLVIENYQVNWSSLEHDLKLNLLNMLELKISNFNAYDLSDVVQALSNFLPWQDLSLHSQQLLFAKINLHTPSMPSQYLANILRSLNKLIPWREMPLNLQATLIFSMLHSAANATAGNIVELLQVIAKFDVASNVKTPMQTQILQIYGQRIKHFTTSQELAISLYELSKVLTWNDLPMPIQENFKHAIRTMLYECNYQDLSFILKAIVALDPKQDLEKEDFFAKLIEQISYHIHNFNAYDLAMTLNALSKFTSWDKLSQRMSGRIINRIKTSNLDFNAQNLVNILTDLNKLGAWHTLPKIEPILIKIIPQYAKEFNIQDLANTFNALSKFYKNATLPEKTLKALLARLDQIIDHCNGQNITNIFHALSKHILWRQLADSLKQAIIATLTDNLSTFNIKDMASTLHACMLFDIFGHSCVQQLTHKLIEKLTQLDMHKFKGKSCVQLATVWEYLKAKHLPVYQEIIALSTVELLEHVQAKSSARLQKSAEPSMLQHEVYQIVKQFYPQAQAETIINSCVSIDILIAPNTVVEVNGPEHFQNKTFNAATMRKHQLLSALGYQVINLNHQVLDELTNSQKLNFVQQALSTPKRQTYAYNLKRQAVTQPLTEDTKKSRLTPLI